MRKVIRAALGVCLGLSLSGWAVAAQPPTTGLGEAWPNTVDVSASPNWHVYVFVMNGVEFIQVNDLHGRVIGAVATAGGQFVTLPIGVYSRFVSTSQQHGARTSSVPTAPATVVYRDSSTMITATPQSDGTTKLTASSIGICTDPTECNGAIN
jgi:hypothetical protein